MATQDDLEQLLRRVVREELEAALVRKARVHPRKRATPAPRVEPSKDVLARVKRTLRRKGLVA